MREAEAGAWSAPEVPSSCNVPVSGPIDLRGRGAIVTGARSGIGQAASLALARAGARLVLSDREACGETLARARRRGRRTGSSRTPSPPGPMTRGYPVPESAAPVGRLGRPEDIAQAVVFLASEMSNYVTGCVLDVNGGLFMTP